MCASVEAWIHLCSGISIMCDFDSMQALMVEVAAKIHVTQEEILRKLSCRRKPGGDSEHLYFTSQNQIGSVDNHESWVPGSVFGRPTFASAPLRLEILIGACAALVLDWLRPMGS